VDEKDGNEAFELAERVVGGAGGLHAFFAGDA